MNAKTKLEAVPTPAQLLREAIAQCDNAAKEIEAIRARTNLLAPIEAEATAAQAELQGILQRDASAMQTWAQGGAIGTAPEPDHKAREEASRKLGQASAKLSAAGGAKAQIEADTREAHGRHQAALQAVRDAEVQVMGQELIQSAHAMKAAALAYLATEQHYFNTRKALLDLDAVKATPIAEQAANIGAPMNIQQEREFLGQVFAKSNQRNGALRQGIEPANAPQVTE